MEEQRYTRYIVEAGTKLRLDEQAISKAAVFYHIFCSQTRASIERYDLKLLIMAALNLAAKVQEISVKLGDIVNTCYKCFHPDVPFLEAGDFYWKLKDSVAKYELLLLRTLKFKLNIQLPHPYLLHYLVALSRWVDDAAWQRSSISSLSWCILQDSFHTELCLSHAPYVIATAVLYLAVQCCKLDIPNTESKRMWWEVFAPDVGELQLQLIGKTILELYDADYSTACKT
eukprot:Em0009g602a